MAERKGCRRIIFSNILNSLRMVLEAMVVYKFAFEIEENRVLLLARHSINELGVH